MAFQLAIFLLMVGKLWAFSSVVGIGSINVAPSRHRARRLLGPRSLLVLQDFVHPSNTLIVPTTWSQATVELPAGGIRSRITKPTRPSSSTSLLYRQHDQEDDESTLLKVRSRTPLGYDVKQAMITTTPTTSTTRSDTAVNMKLIRALGLNQFLILSLATTILTFALFVSQGLDGFQQLNEILDWTYQHNTGGTNESPVWNVWDISLTSQKLAYGVVGALPMLSIGYLIDHSDKQAMSQLYFSTIAMVMTLFGRRRSVPSQSSIPMSATPKQSISVTKPTQALSWSLWLSAITGFCEETVFRCQIPSFLLQLNGGNVLWAFVGQALLFGLGHVSPGVSFREYTALVSVQVLNGILFGLIYVWAGGDIVPSMVAHTIYDFVTFYNVWKEANDQIDYAEQMSLQALPPTDQTNIQWLIQQSSQGNNSRQQKQQQLHLDAQQIDRLKKIFYIFDFDKNQSLSLSEVRKGVVYLSFARAGLKPPPENVVDDLFNQVIKDRKNWQQQRSQQQKSVASTTIENDSNNKDKMDRLSFTDFVYLYKLLTSSQQSMSLSPTSVPN